MRGERGEVRDLRELREKKVHESTQIKKHKLTQKITQTPDKQ
jgi:hypothetical protein